jgi:hypothetical protein
MKHMSLLRALPLLLCILAVGVGCGGGGATGTATSTNGGGTGSGSPFAGTFAGSEEYVQGTFANPIKIMNLGQTTVMIDSAGNLTGETEDAVTGNTYHLTGSVSAGSTSAGTGTITGLPGPFNTPASPNLTVTGNFTLSGVSLSVDLGNSFGEVHMSLIGGHGTTNPYAGTFSGTIKTSTSTIGTVNSFMVDSAGVVSGSYTINGVTTTLSGTLTSQDVAQITALSSNGTIQFTGAAAFAGQSTKMTVFLTSNSNGTVTLSINPATP